MIDKITSGTNENSNLLVFGGLLLVSGVFIAAGYFRSRTR